MNHLSEMRLGFGKNPDSLMLQVTLILYNTLSSSCVRWLHKTP